MASMRELETAAYRSTYAPNKRFCAASAKEHTHRLDSNEHTIYIYSNMSKEMLSLAIVPHGSYTGEICVLAYPVTVGRRCLAIVPHGSFTGEICVLAFPVSVAVVARSIERGLARCVNILVRVRQKNTLLVQPSILRVFADTNCIPHSSFMLCAISSKIMVFTNSKMCRCLHTIFNFVSNITMFCIAVVCAVLSQHEGYSPCELKPHSTNPAISVVLRDWCAIAGAHNQAKGLAAPFGPADAVRVLGNLTQCQRFYQPEHSPGPLAFVASVCAQQGRLYDTKYSVVHPKCLPPTDAPLHLTTCTDLLAESRVHLCNCGLGGDGCTGAASHARPLKRNCPIGMQDRNFWRTYQACHTLVDDWAARTAVYAKARSPLEMLGLMTDCSQRTDVSLNYTQAYYAVESDRASKHAQAVRSLHLQCLLAPKYTTPTLNDYPILPKLVVEWSGQWCRDLF